MEVVSCEGLVEKVANLKVKINDLKNVLSDLEKISFTSSTLPTSPTPSTSSDIKLIDDCLSLLEKYYEGDTRIPLYMHVNKIDVWDPKKKNLLKKLVSFIWSKKSNFLDFIDYLYKHKDDNLTNQQYDDTIAKKINNKLKIFLQTLTNTIEETTVILEGKHQKANEITVVGPDRGKKTSFLPRIVKTLLGTGRNEKYEALLAELFTEGEGNGCSPEQYFSMLHTMGLIAIELCNVNTKKDYITLRMFKDIILEQVEYSTPQNTPSGGATSRRHRRRRRSHSSLHSRKSINRNKKSKKIRKLYTSKRRVRPRNQNKPKNKSRK